MNVTRLIPLIFALALCGCFGAGQTTEVPEFQEIQFDQKPSDEVVPSLLKSQEMKAAATASFFKSLELKTSDDVLAHFGLPTFKSQEGENEVWSYKLTSQPTETRNSVFVAWFIAIPVWSTTEYDVNTKFYFRNSVLEKVMVLRPRTYTKGGWCVAAPFTCDFRNEQPPPAPQSTP